MNNEWLLCVKTNNADHIKTKIDSVIKSNNIKSSVEYKSTKGENSYQFDLFQYTDQFQDVIDSIKNVTMHSLNKFNNDRLTDLSIVSSWSVYGDRGSYHTIHRHNDITHNHVCTVLYLSTSEYDTNNPGSFFAIVNNDVVTHQPSVGDLLIFPVNLLHGTYPQGNGLRQTLSNDFELNYLSGVMAA
jgi:hypothetical protein